MNANLTDHYDAHDWYEDMTGENKSDDEFEDEHDRNGGVPCEGNGGRLLTESPSTFGLVDYLTYCSYAHNRRLSPEVSPREWATIFGAKTPALELRFYLEGGREP